MATEFVPHPIIRETSSPANSLFATDYTHCHSTRLFLHSESVKIHADDNYHQLVHPYTPGKLLVVQVKLFVLMHRDAEHYA
ncbi:hypothetical protein RHSP_43015 [Rhizobium freirei PRF 81]|uniref:Uncharacterized protein n=1 Tax=Rhizobium freirei PRF 81 TaxID=363754 RepID=N6VCF6_9HYPH|nr:hypothetical protein RHSP_43015 [Rhizobium freirei PRF 81]